MHSDLHQEWLQNHTFDELVVGQGATITRVLTDADISGFAAVSGDLNPTHLDDAYARGEGLRGRTAHGMWCGAMVSTLMGTVYPGPGTVYVSQSMQFLAAARSGDKLEIAVKVKSKDAATQHVVLDCVVRKADGKELMIGEAVVKAPSRKQRVPSANGLRWHVFDAAAGVQNLLKQATQHDRIRCAIVHPCDSESLRGALDAALEGLFTPVIVAPRDRLMAVADEAGLDLRDAELEDVPHSHAAAERAAALAAAGLVQALMKGSLHTDELMGAVVRSATGLRTQRRISHAFIMDVPSLDRVIIVTDAAINIFPTLEDKKHIVQNAIDLSTALGFPLPKVAILSSMETVNPDVPSTVEAAALCKMADRKQITGVLLDGPLALDNAIDINAARIKKIDSPVAGVADILVAPDLEAGNMLAKSLSFMADAESARLARVPIILTSRADSVMTRLASCAVAALVAQARRESAGKAVS